MTSEYYITTGGNWQTRIGSFKFPSCTSLVKDGGLSGTVTSSVTGQPISVATVALGSRTATTNAAGFYSFPLLPSGNYLSETASAADYTTDSATNLVISDGSTTIQNFALGTTSASDCLTDTTQSDFQTGVPTNVDLTTNPGDVILFRGAAVDQQNTAGTNTGTTINNNTVLSGQTFIPAVTGSLAICEI